MTRFIYALLLMPFLIDGQLQAQEDPILAISSEYDQDVQHLLRQFCFDCHSGEVIEAELDMSLFKSLSLIHI